MLVLERQPLKRRSKYHFSDLKKETVLYSLFFLCLISKAKDKSENLEVVPRVTIPSTGKFSHLFYYSAHAAP
jgi:hypothetical protein